jgi:pimeloyl-ACP methyl ester carboxylesterase
MAALFLLLIHLVGCSTEARKTGDVIFFSSGVAGDGTWYSSIRDGLQKGGINRPLVSIHWGAPGPLFMMNFSNESIHRDAEMKLAKTIVEARKSDPGRRIDLMGLSAGCGVVLGALKRLPDDIHVRTVVLLAPSVSPQYDITPSLAHVDDFLHAFISEHDTLFLKWRTSNFGSYDNIKTPAAGFVGFQQKYPKLIQHPYQTEWKDLGNDGGHVGTTGSRFVSQIIAPLLR